MTTEVGSETMPRRPAEPDYLDFAGVAEMTGLAEATIAWRHRMGQFIEPDITLGKTPGWRPSTIRTWALARAQARAGRALELVNPDPNPGAGQEYIDEQAAAARVGIAWSTWRKYASQGRTPAPDLILGKSRGWLPETIDTWHANRPGPGARTDLA